MPEHPLNPIEKKDPALFQDILKAHEAALGEGKIPRKYKLLMAMTHDATVGAVNGVKALAGMALQAGATQEEILEAVRLAWFLGGVGSAYVSAQALKEILPG